MGQRITLTTREALEPSSGNPPKDCVVDCDHIPDHALTCISVDLLGGLRVRAGRTTLGPRDLGGAKVRRVLLALVLNRGAAVSKDRLVSMLWEGSPPVGAMATLESYVCVLRRTLQPCHEAGASLITTLAGCYALDMSRVDLDVLRYEGQMSAALQPDVSAIDALPMFQQAMMLGALPLLPEESGCEWLDDIRAVHNHSVRKGLIAAANKVAGLAPGTAEQWAELALDGDPLDESAWHALLQSKESSGQHADGLRAYDRCRRLFAAELGCSPGADLQSLFARLLRGAHEHNRELSQLLDAVVRLHAATPLDAGPPLRAIASSRRGPSDQSGSVEQDCRLLDLLLSSFGGARPHLTGGIGA